MTSHVQDFDLKEAPQSGAYASMLIPNTLRGPQNKAPQSGAYASNAYSKYIYGLCFAENFKKPPLPGGMLLYSE